MVSKILLTDVYIFHDWKRKHDLQSAKQNAINPDEQYKLLQCPGWTTVCVILSCDAIVLVGYCDSYFD